MKVAIISAYFNEPLEVVQRCHDSVLAQTHPCDHFLIADGFPKAEIEGWTATHITLPRNTGDFGDTPRGIGTQYAYTLGYDAVLWLDADNWMEPQHVADMLHAMGDDYVVTCPRTLRWPNGDVLDVCRESDGQTFNDTNCYLIPRKAMIETAAVWVAKPNDRPSIGDRNVWAHVSRLPHKRMPIPSLNYTTTVASHYVERGVTPPPEAKVLCVIDGQFKSLPYTEWLKATTA